ncbi:MAG TPA: sigma-70 family RNA polymerase sigma factor [Thermoanaerobaculia bacterium]|nr:sigma-70 family RNA polymerase sigma factor [Thermoanaerobaculia bacterium]
MMSAVVSIPDRTRAGGEQTDEWHLVRAASGGDSDAFASLYTRYRSMVHAIVLAHVRDYDVEDLVQDVFISAYGRLASLRDPGAFGPWLSTIARNCARDHLRERARRNLRLVNADLPEVSTAASQNERRQAVEVLEAIRSLPETYRETLVLRLVEGLTGPEIAARSGLTHGSVRVNLHRGMKLLHQEIERRSLR